MPEKTRSKVKAAPVPLPPPPPEAPASSETEEERLGYYSDYNAVHRDTLLEKKANRYATDPEYRAKAIKNATDRYYRLKKNAPKTTEHTRVCPMCHRPLPRVAKALYLAVDGTSFGIKKKFVVRMFSIGEISKRLLRQSRTIKTWIAEGVIPESKYRNTNQRRLWTIDQVEMLEQVASKYNLKPPVNYKDIGFIDDVKKSWAKLAPLGIDMSKYKKDEDGYYRREEAEESESAA